MSKFNVIVISFMSAVLGSAIVCTIFFMFIKDSATFNQTVIQPVSQSGVQAILSDFQCRYGETKHIKINGKDDNFSMLDAEPGRVHERLRQYPGLVSTSPHQRGYDQRGRDLILNDYFDVPSNITKGIFIFRPYPTTNYDNDVISLGDFLSFGNTSNLYQPHVFTEELKRLTAHGIWTKTRNNIFSASFKDLRFQLRRRAKHDVTREYQTLLESIQAGGSPKIIDYFVYDDTAVDYAAIAYCTEPTTDMGLTFSEYKFLTKQTDKYQVYSCNFERSAYICNPFIGDTPCSTPLPLACYRDTGTAVPTLAANLPQFFRESIDTFWSGGDIEFTDAIRGDKFATLSDANAYCANSFGPKWRVLDYHDGGVRGVASRRSQTNLSPRVWIDIKDQPKGTCWARDAIVSPNPADPL